MQQAMNKKLELFGLLAQRDQKQRGSYEVAIVLCQKHLLLICTKTNTTLELLPVLGYSRSCEAHTYSSLMRALSNC